MRSGRFPGTVLLITALASLVPAVEAAAVCTAAELIGSDPGCPPSGECRITRTIPVEHGCTLDLGTRPVVLMASGTLAIGGGSVTIRSGDFTLRSGGFIDGRNAGGTIHIQSSATITVEPSTQRGIAVFGDTEGGGITLSAAGDIIIDGRLNAANTPNRTEARGGTIVLEAGGRIVTGSSGDLSAGGGNLANGGSVEILAGTTADIRTMVDVSGNEGGSILIEALDILVGGRLLANGDLGGSGGDIEVLAARTVTVSQVIQSRGAAGTLGGGDGGSISVGTDSGNIVVRAEISARGGTPDGSGGDVAVAAGGSIDLQAGATLNAEGLGTESFAGAVSVQADLDISVAGQLAAPGGFGGGDIDVSAERNVSLTGTLDARSRTAGGNGGTITVLAGLAGPGDVTVAGAINASGAACVGGGICSEGGAVEVTGCSVSLPTGSVIDVKAPGPTGIGGTTLLTARRLLTVRGRIDASGNATPGRNELARASSRPPVLTGSTIVPSPVQTVCDAARCGRRECARVCAPLCDCGNGQVTEFEECDGTATPCGPASTCGAPGTQLACVCIDSCGNGTVDPGEECDGPVGATCRDRGYATGALACTDCAVNESGCQTGFCGDGIIAARGGEICEPGQLKGETCESQGFGRGGTLACTTCTALDTSGCILGVCGDGVLDPGEACDAGAANGDVPNAPCRSACTLPRCGDDITDDVAGEQCDDGNAEDTDGCLADCRAAVCGDGILCTAASCTSGPGGGPEHCDGLATCCLSDCGIKSCDDQSACTADACDPAVGCVYAPAAGRPACDDGDPCTLADACADGVCTGGAPRQCDDGNPCTDDACDPGVGCVHPFNAGPCDDGDACTLDRCTEGVCSGLVTGVDGVGCRIGGLLGLQCDGTSPPRSLSKVIQKKVTSARKFLAKAAAAGKARKEQKLRRKAARQLEVIVKKTAKAARTRKASRRITRDCQRAIDGLVRENQELIGAVVL